jgi:hypothetical protein
VYPWKKPYLTSPEELRETFTRLLQEIIHSNLILDTTESDMCHLQHVTDQLYKKCVRTNRVQGQVCKLHHLYENHMKWFDLEFRVVCANKSSKLQ